MTRLLRRAAIAFAFLLIFAVNSTRAQAQAQVQAQVPTPEAHLGWAPGADFRLAEWKAVAEYFRKVDAASPRVAVEELGESTEGRPFLAAIISSESTIADLASAKEMQAKLADPRKVAGDAEASSLVKRAKPVVMITCTIHSSEVASTLMAMELLRDLATGSDERTKETLDNAILLLIPSVNPDGVDKVAQWYEQSKGKPWEGSGMPWLYHKYAGHDTNRDWFMLNLRETQLLTRLLYREWFPTIAYDVHQMGNQGARIFVPPFFEPLNPNIHPKVSQGIALIGAHMAAALASESKSGVLTNAMYDNWWNGGCRTTPQRHNIVAVLTEAASVKLASPIFQTKSDLKGGSRGFADHQLAVNFTDPWPGGWWRLRDIVDYEKTCARSLLTLASRYREMFQRNYLEMGREAIRRGRQEPPYGWIVPIDPHDPARAIDMARILQQTGVEVHRARKPFASDGVSYEAGSLILMASQPYRPHLKDMMERQAYPDRRGKDGAAEPPYDVAGWTLPLLTRTAVQEARRPIQAETELEKTLIERPKGRIEGSDRAAAFYLANRSNDDFRVLNALLQAKIKVWAVNRAVGELPRESLAFAADDQARRTLAQVLPRAGVVARAIEAPADFPRLTELSFAEPVTATRLGLHQPWTASMDEGWTRLVLETYEFPYSTMHDGDIRSGSLRDRIDALILPSVGPGSLRQGYQPNESHPDYTGGLGRDGGDSIRKFVHDGGKLICLADSCEYAIDLFDLPVKNVLKSLKTSEFYCPGSLLAVDYPLDSATPITPQRDRLTWGMPERGPIYFARSMAFEELNRTMDSKTFMPVKVAAAFPKSNPLESGWLLGPEKIQGKAALLRIQVGKGSVILFGFPPQYRAWTQGTFRLLFNAILR